MKVLNKCLIGFGIAFLSCSLTYGQHANVFSLFIPHQKNAEKEYERGNFLVASKHYKVLVEKDSSSVENILKLANCYHEIHKNAESEYYFKMASRKRALNEKELAEFLDVLYKNKKYDEAQNILKKNFSAASIKKGNNDFQNSVLALRRDSFSYTIKKLDFNSAKSDFSPAFYPNGLLFVSNRDVIHPVKFISNRDSSDFFDLYLTIKDKSGVFGPPTSIRGSSKIFYHEGSSVFTDNFSKLIVTKSLSNSGIKEGGKQMLGMFIMDWDSVKMTTKNEVMFPFNNANYSIGQPAISEDGLRLYFISDMPGGFGGTDIYVSHKEKSQWSTPANLGPKINSEYDEMFPYVKDNNIYFSSNRKGSLGGLDIFVASLAGKSKVKNLGYPMNSHADDFGIVFDKEGLTGYFSSNRNNNEVKDDNIYSFIVNQVVVSVVAKERLTNLPLKNVRIINKQANFESDTFQTDSLGKVKIILKPSNMYNLIAYKSGYREISSPINTKTFTTSGVLNAAFNFDRRYKSYANLLVTDYDSEEPIKNSTVYIYNITRQTLDTAFTNEEGKTILEVENENNYTFMVFNEGKMAMEKLSTKKIGKFSKILFVYPKLEKSIISQVKLSFVDADSLKPQSEVKINILDKTLGFAIDCLSDEEGNFSFTGFPGHVYQIKARKSIRNAELLEYKPRSIREEILIKLKNKYN